MDTQQTHHHLPPLKNQPPAAAAKMMALGSQESSQSIKVQQLYEDSKNHMTHQQSLNAVTSAVKNASIQNLDRPSVTRQDSERGSASQKGSAVGKRVSLTAEAAMKQYMHKLSSFEHHEIFSFPNIYFVGQNAKKRQGVVGGPNNSGYDDENGLYFHTLHDQIAYR
mgnify:FL=1